MSEKVAVTQSYLQDIADAIREKTGSTDTYKPSEFAAAVQNIQAGGGAYYATGDISGRDSSAVASGTNIGTASGLPFKPSHVIIMLSGTSAVSVSSTSYYLPVFVEHGLQSSSAYVRKYSSSYTYVYPTLAYTTITITDDGFIWTSANSSVYLPLGWAYRYIAFAGELLTTGEFDATSVFSANTGGGSID